jgi:peptidoglycan biosynthesis protein MviN/MurJ (putative lipid II flippase)
MELSCKLKGASLIQLVYVFQILINSLSGYLFIRAIGTHYGLGIVASAFDVAFAVPFYVMSVSGFTFLHGAIASQLSRLKATSQKKEQELINTLVTISLLLSLFFFIAGYYYIDNLVEVFAPGFSEMGKELTRELLFFTLPLTVSLGLGTILGAVFTAHELPVAGEMPLTLARLLTTFYLVGGRGTPPITEVGQSIFITSFLGLAILFLLMIKLAGIIYRPSLVFNRDLLDFAKVSLGLFFASIMAVFSSAYMKRLASLGSSETVAAISFALAFVGPISLVLGKFFNFRNTAKDARLLMGDHLDARWSSLLREIFLTVIVSGIIALLILSLLPDLVKLLFYGGQFDYLAVARVCEFAVPLIWSLIPSVILWTVLSPILNGKGRYYAGIIYALGSVFQIVVNFLLFNRIGPIVLVWSYTAGIFLQCGLSLCVLWQVRLLSEDSIRFARQ